MAMAKRGLNNLQEPKQDIPERQEDRERWLDHLSETIVNECWLAPSTEDLNMIHEGYLAQVGDKAEDAYPFCVCRQGI